MNFGRIVIAYLFGGITLDMDVISNQPIKNIINLDKADGDLYLCPVEAGLFGKGSCSWSTIGEFASRIEENGYVF